MILFIPYDQKSISDFIPLDQNTYFDKKKIKSFWKDALWYLKTKLKYCLTRLFLKLLFCFKEKSSQTQIKKALTKIKDFFFSMKKTNV